MNKVTELELSKELAKFIKIDTFDAWTRVMAGNKGEEDKGGEWHLIPRDAVPFFNKDAQYVLAYDIHDLLSWLPKVIPNNRGFFNESDYSLVIDMDAGRVVYEAQDAGDGSYLDLEGAERIFKDISDLPQALGQLCIWVNENGHGGGE
jgi:hypothetical protein